jgi:hypothetical protein
MDHYPKAIMISLVHCLPLPQDGHYGPGRVLT